MKEMTKEQYIVAAARVRFAHYGFNKTTMAEIAADCQMSAANIYRYFSGKKEILAQIARDFFTEVEEDIERRIANASLSPLEKIESVVLVSLNNSYERHSTSPQINEAISVICSDRVDLIVDHRQHKIAKLVHILETGVASGFFVPHETAERAEAILNGTVLIHPVFLGMYDIEYLRESLSKVVVMMTEGIVVEAKVGNQ